MALHNDPSAARDVTRAAAPQLGLTNGQIAVSPTSCPATGGAQATVAVTYPMSFITNMFGSTITLTGKGVMRCNG